MLAVNGPSLVMIGHPSGLPRKYAGGATVDAVMLPDADSSTAGLQCTGGVYPARTCSYEGDSVCDVPEHCAAGTDNADCGTVCMCRISCHRDNGGFGSNLQSCGPG